MKKILISTALAAGLVFASAGSASAGDGPVKATPDPVRDLPGCHGKLNATINHDSGIQDHGKDSKGPGYTFRDGQLFQEIRGAFWPSVCGPGAGTG